LEEELGKCSDKNQKWKKIYYQAFIAKAIYWTLAESMRIKTDEMLDHYFIYISNESLVGPFDEKDLNCYWFAMKYRGNDSVSILDVFPNIYSYEYSDEKVFCNWFLSQCPKVEKVNPTGSSVVCKVVNKVYGNKIEEKEKEWTKSCGNPGVLQDLLKNCGVYETVLMREWDWLGDSYNPVSLRIIYNTEGRVIVMRCEITKTKTGTWNMQCGPEKKPATKPIT